MRIAVAMPQVPFIKGGAEILTETLVAELKARKYEVDSILLPFKWYPVERLILDSLAWRQFDLTEANGQKIDRLICTKFPSYLALHPDKVLWLYHQHRQIYDLFGHPMHDFHHDARGTDARALVSDLDRVGFEGCRKIYTISKNVSSRLQRYCGVTAPALYPPPRGKERFISGAYGDYILYVGRLDRMKRVDQLVAAARHLKPGGRMVIAGRGPEHANLQRQIADLGVADRVQLLGFVPDAELYPLYAGARAVYYSPVDEDYGFSTVEAFLSKKPLLTFTDSGGVLEFVADGETGRVVEPSPENLAEISNQILADAAGARRMGEAGYELVKDISWDPVIEQLLA